MFSKCLPRHFGFSGFHIPLLQLYVSSYCVLALLHFMVMLQPLGTPALDVLTLAVALVGPWLHVVVYSKFSEVVNWHWCLWTIDVDPHICSVTNTRRIIDIIEFFCNHIKIEYLYLLTFSFLFFVNVSAFATWKRRESCFIFLHFEKQCNVLRTKNVGKIRPDNDDRQSPETREINDERLGDHHKWHILESQIFQEDIHKWALCDLFLTEGKLSALCIVSKVSNK